MTTISNDELFKKLKEDESRVEDKINYNHPKKTNNKSIRLSIGRAIINNVLPDDYPLINEVIDKKKQGQIIKELLNKYDSETASKVISELQRVGFRLAAINPKSFRIDVFDPSDEWKKKKEEFQNNADSLSDKEFLKKAEELNKEYINELNKKDIGIQDVIYSGAKGALSDWQALLVSRGLVVDVEGNIKRIKNASNDGVTIEEFYDSASQSRRNYFYKSTMTAKPGYLARRITMANANMKTTEKDCRTKSYLEIFITKDKASTFSDRYYMNSGKLTLIEDTNDIVNKKIKLRSPLYCKSKNGICQTCYGKLAEKLNNKNIGIVAGGAVNNEAVNAMMKMKHKSSQVDFIEVNFIDMIEKSNADVKLLNALFDIKEKEIYAKKDISIVINQKDYNEELFTDFGDRFLIPGILDVEYGKLPDIEYTTLPFNFNVDVWKPESINLDKKLIKLQYSSGEKVISKDYFIKETDPAIIDRLVEGGMKYLQKPELLLEAMQQELPKIDSVHLELIVSNMFRDKDDNTIPGRLTNYKNVELLGCKRLPYIDSWVSGLAFENINKAVKTALVDGRDAQLNPVEKIVLDRHYGDENHG